MGKELEKFNLDKAMTEVKKKVKSAIVELIPEAEWDRLIRKEVNEVVNKGIGKMVEDEFKKETTKRIHAYLASSEFNTTWDSNGKVQMSEYVKSILVDNSGDILKNIMLEPMQLIIDAIKQKFYDLSQSLQRGY